MFHNGPYHGGVGNSIDFVEQLLMFCRRKPRTLFAFPAVIAVCLDHVRLSVIKTPMYLLVSDVSSILLWIAYDVSNLFAGLKIGIPIVLLFVALVAGLM